MITDSAIIRRIREHELRELLALYRDLHDQDAPLPSEEEVAKVWRSICADPNLVYVVAEVERQLVSSCTLAIVPNLTRGARPYAVIEHVVTRRDSRGRGLATRVLRYATEMARARRCYKVMLLTGSKLPQTLRFYERAGFLRDVKTGFVMPLE